MSDILRELLVGLGFDFDKKSANEVMGVIEGVKKAALALGVAFSLHEVAEFVQGTVEEMAKLGDEVGELSQKIGVSAQALQELGAIAKDNGASQAELATGLKFISKNAAEAAAKGGEAAEGFAQLGVNVRDAHGQLKPAEQLFTEISDGIKGMKNETERTALATKLLGRSGTQLIPTLLKGSEALAKEREEVRALGGVMSDDFIAMSDKFEAAGEKQAQAAQGAKIAFSEGLLPVLLELREESLKFMVKVVQPLARAVGKGLGKAVDVAAKALRTLLSLVKPIVDGLAGMSSGLGKAIEFSDMLTAAILGLTALLVAKSAVMALAWAVANAPLLLTILLVAAIAIAIGLLIEDFIKMGEGGESVTGMLVQGFIDLYDEIGSIPGVIWAALKTALAFWLEFFGMAHDEAVDFVANLDDIFSNFWQNAIDYWAGLFNGFIGGIVDKFRAIASVVGIGGGGSQTTVNNNMQANVNANVTGATTPEQVGPAVANHVGLAMDGMLQSTQQNYVTAAP